MLKNKILIFGIVILILVGAGYGGYWYWKSQKIEDVTFVVMKGGSTEFLMNVIKAEGLDQKNRINIIPQVAPSPPEGERRFFAREGVDAAPIGDTTIALDNLKGNNSRIIGPYVLNIISILVNKDSPYQTIFDLQGVKLGTRTKTTALYQTLAIVMKKKGIDPETYFKLVFPPSIPESAAYLERGEVDAVAIPEPEATKLLATGKYREIATLRDLWRELTGEQFGFVYTVVHQDWIDAHPKAAKRLSKTVLDGASFIRNNPEIIVKYKDLFGVKTDEEVKLLKERMPRIYPDTWGEKDISNINLVLKTAVELGVLSELPKENIVVRLK